MSAWDFLRPASVRLERGRTDPDAYYDDRLDLAALRRVELDPLGPDGDGRWLPTLWDPDADRATRAGYETAPDKAVLILAGYLLLGRGLPGEDPQQRGLARTVRPHQPDDVPRREHEVEPGEQDAGAVTGDEAGGLQRGAHLPVNGTRGWSALRWVAL